MFYIIISNIGLAIMTIVMFVRYSHFRISSNLKIKDLEKNVKTQMESKIELETKLRAEAKTENEQVKNLLREMEQLRKERQSEIKLRLEAEKQIELSLQKIQDTQKRMNDWKLLQDAAARESKEAIVKIGDEIFTKISRNYKDEVAQSKNTIDLATKNITEKLENVSNALAKLKKSDGIFAAQDVSDIAAEASKPAIVNDDTIKKAVNDVASLAEVSGFKIGENYIISSRLDQDKAKFMLCDIALLINKTLYLIDFKAIRYLKHYDEAKDKTKALTSLKPNLDKYLSYISNPKYQAAVKKIVTELKINFAEMQVVFGVRNQDDMKIIKDVQYNDKISKLGLKLLDINAVNDLIL